MPTKCYLCACSFDNGIHLQHGEHIIQNAIGGALISHDILCEACGGKLGASVDTAFADALSPLTVLLHPPRDRGDHAQAEIRMVANTAEAIPLEKVQLSLNRDFSVVPARPVFLQSDSQQTVTVIGATEKQAKQYAKCEKVGYLIEKGYTLVVGTNAAAYAKSLLLPVSPGSTDVLRGVLKIAIGYASHCGVPREYFDHLLELDDLINSEMLLRSTVFSYYPTTDAERLFETEKHTHEDWYPTHHLYLFSQDKNLYCYVELFGTIQKYVHLSGKYDGSPLVKKFVQKAEKWVFDEKAFTAISCSDLDILARQFGVEMSGRSWIDIQNDVLHQARTRAYSLDPDETIKKISNMIDRLIMYSYLNSPDEFDVVRSLFMKVNAAKEELGLSLLDDIKADPAFALQLSEKTFEDFRIGSVEQSSPELAKGTQAEAIEKYEAYKFYEFLRAKSREDLLQYCVI